ncbi:MAG: hypothetical protein ACUVQG_14320 [Thermogutta sp.]
MPKKQPKSTLEVFQQLQEIMSFVPSEAQKSGMIEAVRQVQGFLDQIVRAMQMFPTQEQILESQIPDSLDQIASFLQSVSAVGQRPSAGRKRGGQARPAIEPEAILHQIEGLANEQLERALRDFGPTVNVLKEILNLLGASARGSNKKEDLIRRVVDEIRTRRDLSGLRDGAAP